MRFSRLRCLRSRNGQLALVALVAAVGIVVVPSAASEALATNIKVPPTRGVSPMSGGVGTRVTITGRQFWRATAVKFNGTGAMFRVVSSTQITASVPSGATTGPITVTTPAGTATMRSFAILYGVYGGYYDTHHLYNPQPKPSPWQGSPNVVFVGQPDSSSSGGWDTSAIRIDNLSGAPLNSVTVTVSIGTKQFALWGTHSILAGQSLILAQMGLGTFDGSDTNHAGCYGCDPTLCTTSVATTLPIVHITVNGITSNLPDRTQVLNSQGVDTADCPDTGSINTRKDESETWQQLG